MKRFARFWWDFVVGDDWRIAAGIAVAIGLVALLHHVRVTSWWVLPLAVAALRARVLAQSTASHPGGGANAIGVAAATPEGTTVAPPGRYGGVVGIAMQYLGVPYVYGGASPSGFDCSGLVMYAYAQMGVSLPHSSYAQYSMGVAVSRDQLQPGDLVFFNGLGHVGIYVGGGQFIHAPHTGDVVKISSLSDSWYAAEYQGAVRVTG